MSVIDTIRGRSRGRSPARVHATTHAEHTVAGDLDRAAERTEGSSTDAVLAALATRALASSRARTGRRARRASRAATRAAGRRQVRIDHQRRRAQHLRHPRTAERLAHALDHDVRSTRIGYLTSWLPGFVVLAVAAGMIANDPPFVAATLRRTFDIPDGTPLWAVQDPNVLVSLAAAVIITVLLLGGAHLLGKAYASLLFRGPLLRPPGRYREAAVAHEVLPAGRSAVIAALGSAVMAFFVWFLHTIAEERFTGGIAAAFSGQDGMRVETAVTMFVTCLPVAVVVLEVIANHPVFVHTRKAARWSLVLRLTERRDIRRDERLARRAAASRRRARIAMADLGDMIADVTLRAQAEHIEGAVRTGKLDISTVAEALGVSVPDGRDLDERDAVPTPRIDVTGRVRTGELLTPIVSNRVVEAIAAFRAVDEADEVAPIARLWAAERDAAARRGATNADADTSPSDAVTRHWLHAEDDTSTPTDTAAHAA
ncbi:hypothetical protein Cch01nite_13720 [Cellulomonas chitinilytica]|uniref:Uncharacterized protein n=1 Tax=Cellulomonas chitinilytica TaxID=398759 RepID=A0A919TZA3_9CELL|nr:hypothetical protein [Cellulomonas chitinilytica]GIG20648.1 hypothetical protein Cch01nite_13720 [Cellulomonas chitinilytica]